VAADLADVGDVRLLAARARDLGGGHVDILVNNAGLAPFGPSTAVTVEEIDDVTAINVKAPFLLVSELVPDMVDRGSGAVVNVSTMVANFGMPGMALYGSSKAALQLLTKAWAAEFGPLGVRVNAVSPGPIRTEGTAAMGEGLDQLASTTPAGTPGAADDVAAAIVFLASDAAHHIQGAILPVDGGRLAV
jgi:NAD(P)-dependent dehydrogenase (short-subunit alcohol dehydrogenase family)